MDFNEKKEFVIPEVIKSETYQTASAEHCHQVKDNDCDWVMKA